MLTPRRCDLALSSPILTDGVGNATGQLGEGREYVSMLYRMALLVDKHLDNASSLVVQ